MCYNLGFCISNCCLQSKCMAIIWYFCCLARKCMAIECYFCCLERRYNAMECYFILFNTIRNLENILSFYLMRISSKLIWEVFYSTLCFLISYYYFFLMKVNHILHEKWICMHMLEDQNKIFHFLPKKWEVA